MVSPPGDDGRVSGTKTRTTPGVRKREYRRKDRTLSTRYTARLTYLDGAGERVYDESRSFTTRREAAAEYIRMKAAHDAGTYTAPMGVSTRIGPSVLI